MRRKNSSKSTNNRKGGGSQAPPRIITSLPVQSNPSIRITRATNRFLNYQSNTGIDTLSSSNLQLTFSPGATNYRIGGVSIYNDSLPNLSEFVTLFDQYRVSKVRVRFDVTYQYSNSGSAGPVYPLIYYVADYDDPGDAGMQDVLQYPQLQIHNFAKDGYTPLFLEFAPKPLRDIAGSGVSTSYGPMGYSPWIRTSETQTPHYGLKFVFNPNGMSLGTSMNVMVTVWYDLDFTNPK